MATPFMSSAVGRLGRRTGSVLLAGLLSACQLTHPDTGAQAPPPPGANPAAMPAGVASPTGMSASDRADARAADQRAYRAWNDYASFTVGAYASSHGYPHDSFERLEFGVHQGKNTWVLGLNRVARFGLIDSGVDATVYRTLGQGYWGYVYGAYNPNSVFTPRTAYGAELDRDIGSWEFAAAFTRMFFQTSTVDLYDPGVTYSFTDQWSLGARWYFVPGSGAHSLVLMPVYQDDHHDRYYASLSAGTLAERPTAYADYQKYQGYSVGVGAERRLTPRFSVGADLLYQHRAGLYDRHGADLFAKVWW